MADTNVEKNLVPDSDAEAIWFDAGLAVVRMPSDTTDNQFSVVEHTAPQNQAIPWHRMNEHTTTMTVLEGKITFWLGDPSTPAMEAEQGDTILVPRGIPLAMRVDSQKARYIEVNTPGGIDKFYREGGLPAQSQTLPDTETDQERIMNAAKRYGVEIIGESPQPGQNSVTVNQ